VEALHRKLLNELMVFGIAAGWEPHLRHLGLQMHIAAGEQLEMDLMMCLLIQIQCTMCPMSLGQKTGQ
jgi:hypothetical protein